MGIDLVGLALNEENDDDEEENAKDNEDELRTYAEDKEQGTDDIYAEGNEKTNDNLARTDAEYNEEETNVKRKFENISPLHVSWTNNDNMETQIVDMTKVPEPNKEPK